MQNKEINSDNYPEQIVVSENEPRFLSANNQSNNFFDDNITGLMKNQNKSADINKPLKTSKLTNQTITTNASKDITSPTDSNIDTNVQDTSEQSVGENSSSINIANNNYNVQNINPDNNVLHNDNSKDITNPTDSNIDATNPTDSNIDAKVQDTSEPNTGENQENSKPHIIEIITGSSMFKYVLGAMIIFAICFISSLFTFNIMLTPVEVQGYSMLPTINNTAVGENANVYNDIVYISKTKNIKYKDIVVIKEGKTPSGKQIIKRVIACPGETITFKRVGTEFNALQEYFLVDIYINGVKLNETYTNETQTKIQNLYETSKYYQYNNTIVSALQYNETNGTQTQFSVTLKDDEYFVMGDNRNGYLSDDERKHGSVDSRMFGPIKKDEIVGKVSLHIKYGENMIQAIWKSLFAVRLHKI